MTCSSLDIIKARFFEECLYQSLACTRSVNMLRLLLILLLSIFIYFSIKLWRVQTYWKRKGIAYDVPVPFFGIMLDIIIGRKSFFECLDEIYRAHTDARYMPKV